MSFTYEYKSYHQNPPLVKQFSPHCCLDTQPTGYNRLHIIESRLGGEISALISIDG